LELHFALGSDTTAAVYITFFSGGDDQMTVVYHSIGFIVDLSLVVTPTAKIRTTVAQFVIPIDLVEGITVKMLLEKELARSMSTTS
jgi:hypothetical protein